jgi:hypothetical protein
MAIFAGQKSFASVVETPEEQAISDAELKTHCMKYLDLLRGKYLLTRPKMSRLRLIGTSRVRCKPKFMSTQ